MQINSLGTQSSTQFLLSVSPNLSPEGLVAYLLKRILETIKGSITDENNQALTDENENVITFDNAKFYPEMSLFYWRSRINGNWLEKQIVFLLREPHAD
jgi:hypothetical protein